MNKRIKDIAKQAGFDIDLLSQPYPGGFPRDDMLVLDSFSKLIIEECAKAAELHARSFSDGDAGIGCYGAAAAVRAVGK